MYACRRKIMISLSYHILGPEESLMRYLRGLDVIVEVIPEGLDVGDVFGTALTCQMAGEEYCAEQSDLSSSWQSTPIRTKCDEAQLAFLGLLDARYVLQLEGRVASE